MSQIPFLGKKLLVLTAHPDDESFAAGGTLYQNHELGGETYLVCATLGEKGVSHMAHPVTAEEMKQIRKAELEQCASVLQIKEVKTLDFPDGNLADFVENLVTEFKAAVELYKPDFILGFGEDGLTGHRDHIAAGKAALVVSQDSHIPMYTFCFPPEVLKNSKDSFLARRKFGVYADLKTDLNPDIKVMVDSEIKAQAIKAHASQMDVDGQILSNFSDQDRKLMLETEFFIKS